MTPRSNPRRGVGFCVACAGTGQFVLAVDPVAGDSCAAHQALTRAARLTQDMQRRTADQQVAQERAGQLTLTDLASVGATAVARPVLVAAAAQANRGGAPAGLVPGTSGDTTVETTRSGQHRLALPGTPRRRYATGQQEWCVPCAQAGVTRLGVSRDGPGSAPKCMPCWRAEQQRQSRRELAELEAELCDGLAGADRAAGCPVCAEDAAPEQPVDELLPPAALQASRRQPTGPTRRSGCWLCGDSQWVAQLREQFARDQDAVAVAVEEEFERITVRAEAEARVEALTAWIDRLQAVLTAYHRGGGRGRPVVLLADLIARDAGARTTTRGRPGMLLYVGAVLAVDSDWRSGRRALPGRDRTALLVGCSTGAVTAAWRRLTATLGWAVRTKLGGRLSLAERKAAGRWNDRAEFDIVPAHHGDPAARAPHVPQALAILGELLRHAHGLLEQAHSDLDELRARTGTWTDWPEQVQRAQLRQAVQRVARAATDPASAGDLAMNICTPHMVSRGEYLSSCSLGLHFSRPIMIHSPNQARQPQSGWGNNGASRSPTRPGWADLESNAAWGCGSLPVEQPRKLRTRWRRSHRARPSWTAWAEPLARDLGKLWPWLDRAGVRRPRVVATLGARLGPDWTAPALVRFVSERHGGPLLAEPLEPLGYLRHVLDEALTGEVEPPYEARRAVEHRRELSTAAAAGQRERTGRARAAATAALQQATHGAARSAREELAALRARLPQGRPTDRGRLGNAPAAIDCEWPDVALPGSGLPRQESR